ncbi:MAG: hypothetical protein A0129_14195 [Limnobacter sp. CACIAM 66H1]|nr:MAG: hypothetical protein A0129_14195 [Limnobacter sp. CACIAM 66H1]
MKRIDQLLYFGKGQPNLAVVPIVRKISSRDLASLHKALIFQRSQTLCRMNKHRDSFDCLSTQVIQPTGNSALMIKSRIKTGTVFTIGP